MIRANAYEAAFEAYLRQRRLPYVAVDETRRALLADASLKSMDFIVYHPLTRNWLVDVKGRKRLPGRNWESWATLEDLRSLDQWEKVFGQDFRGLLIFAYPVKPDSEEAREASHSVVELSKNTYIFYGIWLEDYRRHMRQRSPRWQTVWIPAGPFACCRFPLGELFEEEIRLGEKQERGEDFPRTEKTSSMTPTAGIAECL